MKRLLLISALLFAAMSVMAQNSITMKFTAQNHDGQYPLNGINYAEDRLEYDVNVLSSSAWQSFFESHGAVSLPAAGYREFDSQNPIVIGGIQTHKNYWSASPKTDTSLETDAYYIGFSKWGLDMHHNFKCYGKSVRLIHQVDCFVG